MRRATLPDGCPGSIRLIRRSGGFSAARRTGRTPSAVRQIPRGLAVRRKDLPATAKRLGKTGLFRVQRPASQFVQRAQHSPDSQQPLRKAERPVLHRAEAQRADGAVALRPARLRRGRSFRKQAAVRALDEAQRRLAIPEHLQHRLAAVRAGALAVEQSARAARIAAADGRQHGLAALALQRAQPVLPLHRAVAQPVVRNLRIALGRGRIDGVKRAVQPRSQLRRAVQPEQTEVFVHRQ